MDEMGTWPAALPVPGRGAHRSVRHGACVMEYAALLSGEGHGDHPVGVHPDLSALCRRVNDGLGDEGRAELVRLVPALLGTGIGERRTAAEDAGFRAVVEVLRRHLLRHGFPADPPVPRAAWSEPPERIDPGTGGGTAVLDRPAETPSRAARTSTRLWANESLAVLLSRRRDDREMVELLEEMAHEVRAAQGLPPVGTSGPYRPSPAGMIDATGAAGAH
jgi:hypothetical protein